MEEYVNVDGRMYRLTVTQPLTLEQRNTTIQQIRSGQLQSLQGTGSGCASGRCGGGHAVNANWNYNVPQAYSGIYGMATGPTTAATAATCLTNAGSGTTVTLTATPGAGAAPYTVSFHRQIATGTNGGITTLISYSGQAEGAATSTGYTISDIDVAGSTGTTATTLTVAGVAVVIPALASGVVRFLTSITDSCPVPSGGPGYCVEYCDVSLVCTPPTCNFVVT